MKALSSKQKKILDFIKGSLREKGYPPSIREIARSCGISSTSVVDYNLNILEREGYLRRSPEVSRGIGLLSGAGSLGSLVAVPLVGQIAAGKPIPVPEADAWSLGGVDTLELPAELVGSKKDVYALKVKGNSMVDALIGDGDTVLMQGVKSADNGDMVGVWLKKEREVTLKRFYHEGHRIRLQPANSALKPIYTDPDNVEIQGKVIAVIRRLE